MGKNKQAQRTKNNARPSNSSRSAELLGTGIPNFVGFSVVKDGGYVPVLPGLSFSSVNEVEMNNVDANFQILLKKMNKKDATTKCKALQEFAVMCRDSEMSVVEGMLPFWPRLYCALAIDVEHRVREAAQLAHAAVAKRAGKNIALYLKQLAGAWFTSQYDTHPPAASAAINSFNKTFPQKKVISAIIHCQREILMYISDNIILHTPQSLSAQKSLSVEEMEAKYQKVLIASLQSYSSYLKKVPIEEIEKLIDIHKKIISSAIFWKLVKYDAIPIKIAFFNVLMAMIDNTDILLQNEKKRTVTTIMNCLDETEPGILSAVWEAMLVAINKIEDWYTVVSIEKLVLPKLWRVLRSGGQCCASIVYPNLLPFVSQFPKLNIDTNNLYVNFFNNMREGFFVKSVQMSRSEMFAVTTSFIECLRYSILLNVNNPELCSKLCREQLVPLLEICLKENTPMKNILFCEVTYLVRYWSKNRDTEGLKTYSNLMNEFWNELIILFNSLIDASDDPASFETPDMHNSQVELLVTLKNAPAHSRKNLNVKFFEPEETINSQDEIKKVEIDTDTVFNSELNNFVNSLCMTYFKKINDQQSKKYIKYLNKFTTCFEDRDFSVSLLKSLSAKINFFNFYNETLRNWLLQKSKESEHIVELIFNLIKYMSDFEKQEVLKSLTELNDILIIRSVIQCGLSKNNRNDPVVKEWCSQSKVINLLIDVAKDVVAGNYSDLEKNQNIILLAFEATDDGNLLINEDGLNEIVFILCNSFHGIDETSLLQFSKLISSIVPLTWSHKQSTVAAIQVLQSLFELCLQESFSNDSVATDTIREVWKKGLVAATQKLSRSKFLDLTKKFASIMWQKIYDSREEHNKELLVDIAADFLEVICNGDFNGKTDFTNEIILTFLTESDIKIWIAEVTGIVMYGEVITGRLYISTLDQKLNIYKDCVSIDLTSGTVVDNTENCLKWALFNTNLLNNLHLRLSYNGDYDKTEKTSTYYVNLSGFTEILINTVYSITLGQIYGNHYQSSKHYDNVSKILAIVKENFKQLQQYFNGDTYSEILNRVKNNYSKYGSMFSYIIHFYCTELHTNERSKALFDNRRDDDNDSNDELGLQELQILSEYIKSKDISISTINDISELITARSVLAGQEDCSTCFNVFEKIIAYEKETPALLLLDCSSDISNLSWEKLTLPLETIRLLTELVKKVPTKLTNVHWNFILISLVLWQLSVEKSKKNATDFKVSALIIAVCQLYCAIQKLIYKHEQEKIEDLPPMLLDEWKNVFANEIQREIIQTWMLYAEAYNEKTTALKPVIVLDCLGKAVQLLNGSILFKEEPNVPTMVFIDLDGIIQLSLKLLQSPIASIQLGAYHVLKHVVAELVQRDKALVELEDFDPSTLNINILKNVLQDTQNIVNTILMDFKLCDTVSCTIQLYTDSYTYTMGYLLTWAIILEMCAKSHGDLRYQYAEILKDKFFPCLLNNIFRLMPVEVLQDNKNKGAKLTEIFTTTPSLNFGESWTEWKLDHIVCWLYTNSLRHLPILVRQWWSTADSRVSAAVDKITMHYVSPMLCHEELLNNKMVNIENMQVNFHPTAREVVATYQMDDMKLELNIILPPNHPLGPVTVESGVQPGGTANWRNCHMQLSILLTHQNGSVWDGLALWKKNLDKKFAGVEECYICFSIFHISTHQIPKLSCHTCRKKFHTPCLYKWFSMSLQSTCPICRNVF